MCTTSIRCIEGRSWHQMLRQSSNRRGAGRGGGGGGGSRLQHAGQRRGEGRPIPQLLLDDRPHPVQETLCPPASPPSVRCTLVHPIQTTALAVAVACQ